MSWSRESRPCADPSESPEAMPWKNIERPRSSNISVRYRSITIDRLDSQRFLLPSILLSARWIVMARILVAEDSLTHTELLRSILVSDDHEVVCVADGQEAWERVQSEGCDAIVTDLNMPQMDGCQLVAKLTESNPEIPAVVVTARGSESLAVDALAIGAIDFVPKQSLNQLLVKVVRQVLGYRQADQSAARLSGQLKAPEFYFKLRSDSGSIPFVANYLVMTMAAAGCGTPNDRYRTATALAAAIFNA